MTDLDRASDALHVSLNKGGITDELLAYGVVYAMKEAVDFALTVTHCEKCRSWHRGWEDMGDYGYCAKLNINSRKDFYCGEGRKKDDA